VLALGGAVAAWYLRRDHPLCAGETGRVDIALGARANSPSPVVPDAVHPELHTLLTRAANAEQPIVVYRIDGKPTEAIRKVLTGAPKASLPRRDAVATFVSTMESALAQVRPVHSEAAPLQALELAARDSPRGGTIVLVDSGLQTVAPLDFRAPGMLDAKPDDVVAELRAVKAIPDLAGHRVILLGLGDTVSPQDQLDSQSRDNVIAIWSAMVTAGGVDRSCLEVLRDPPRDATAVTPAQHVTPVPVRTVEPPRPCEPIRLYNGGPVGFVEEGADLRNPAAATGFLKPYAEQITDRNMRVKLIGTTARWGPADGQRALGKQRAEAVKELLIKLGIPRDWIRTDGVGSYSDYYLDDNGPEGPLSPGPAALNRSVVFDLICTGAW
jgi:outer membrane protein OmpA-like peptidoglycan-associated protein